MIYFALVVALLVGWYSREVLERLKAIQTVVTAKLHKEQTKAQEPQSRIVEELTPAQMEAKQQADMIRNLNS